jgi:site-specific DNA-adenine methylase
MTAYHGGKQRIGKKLAKVITEKSIGISEDENWDIKGYCEPFCGMLGVYQHVLKMFEEADYKLKYKAGDINKNVVMMWKAAQKGWKPPIKISEKKYNQLKKSSPSALRGYAGYQYSFGGQFFEGYAPKYGKNPDSTRASNNVNKIATELKKVKFFNKSYKYFSGLKGYVIYCDPPYEQTDSRFYGESKKTAFDTKEFWEWCRKMSEENLIFVSSYKTPKGVTGFRKTFSSTHKLTGINTKNKQRTENLFYI